MHIVTVFLFLSLIAAEVSVRIVGVVDGDTVDVLVGGNQHFRVRLNEIDAPESKQPFGQRAKQVLSGKLFGKDVRIETLPKKDQYGRTIGTIHLNNEKVNLWMVLEVWAWRLRPVFEI